MAFGGSWGDNGEGAPVVNNIWDDPPKSKKLSTREWWIMWRWLHQNNGPATIQGGPIDPGDCIVMDPGHIVIRQHSANSYCTHIKRVGPWAGDQTVFKVTKRTQPFPNKP